MRDAHDRPAVDVTYHLEPDTFAQLHEQYRDAVANGYEGEFLQFLVTHCRERDVNLCIDAVDVRRN